MDASFDDVVIQEQDKIMTAMKSMGKLTAEYYTILLKQGLSTEQAFALAGDWHHIMWTNSTKLPALSKGE